LLVFAVVLIVLSVGNLIFQITWPYPTEIFEAAQLSSTRLILSGENPYAFEHRPFQTNVYGPLYPYVSSILSGLLGDGFMSHRFVSIICILLSSAILFWATVQQGVAASIRWPVVSLYAFHLTHSIQATARPDALGAFLFLWAGYLVWNKDCSRRSLFLATLLAMLGLAAKPYFILCVPFIGLYLFLSRGLTSAAGLALGFIVALTLSVFVMSILFECYLTEVFVIHRNAQSLFGGHMIWNLIYYSLFFAPLIFVSLSGLFREWLLNKRTVFKNRNLISDVLFWSGIAVIVVRLGWHTGNGIIYYHHLVTPFLLWSFAYWSSQRSAKDVLPKIALCLSLTMSIIFVDRPTPESHEWSELEDRIHAGTSTLLGPTLSHYGDGKETFTFDNGQSRYLELVLSGVPSDTSEQYYKRSSEFLGNIRDRLRSQSYGEVIVFKDNWSLLENSKFFRPDESAFRLLDHYYISKRFRAPIIYGAYIGAQKKIDQILVLSPRGSSHYFARTRVDRG
jgi:hypothetical protein